MTYRIFYLGWHVKETSHRFNDIVHFGNFWYLPELEQEQMSEALETCLVRDGIRGT